MELMKQLCYIVMFIGKKKWCQHVWLDGNFVFLLIWYMREYYGSKVYSKFDEWWWLVISETTMTTTTKQNKNPTHIHTNTKLCFEYIYHESINLVHNIQHINFSLVNNGEYPSKLFFSAFACGCFPSSYCDDYGLITNWKKSYYNHYY